jgi:4-amino-4-deoxy-L-arabinose transferase-like glycosyltransferase
MSATTLPEPQARDLRDERLRTPDRLRALVRGDVDDPAWARPALLALLSLTAVAYLLDLTASGYANSFYAAAVQAGTRSWKAFFFGSLDSSSFITVDKPPASLWVMALSGRIFGFSSASMLVPQVLEGLAAVALLYAAVKRWFGAGAGLLAGAMLAITPVAALMFRFNNPDALLVCLLVASAYCLVRAIETASTRWLIAVGTLLGFAFLTKMLQAFLVLPGFTLAYAVAAPTPALRRARQLLAGGLAVLVSCGWWVAIVALWPAGSRPMIDGSPDNNIFNLIFGYNGLGRIFGASGGPGGGGGASFSGSTGPFRLFNDLMGGQASWLLPAALITLVAGLWWTRRAPRTDRTRAALLVWGGWLLVTGAVFSFSSGVIHTYYTVALAPAIAALVAIGAVLAWRERGQLAARVLMAGGVAASAGWAIVLLGRTSSWEPWLIPVIAVSGIAAVAALLVPAELWTRIGIGIAPAHVGRVAATLAAVACLSGPLAYTVQTLSTAHTGSLPTAGPSSATTAGFGGGGFGRAGGGFGRAGGGFGRAGGGFGGGGLPGGSTSRSGLPGGGTARTGLPSGFPGGSGGLGAAGGFGGGGGAGGGGTANATLVKALEKDAGSYRWVAATDGSQSAATLELASGGDPVMAIGGFNGEGGHLSLAQFEKYVKAGDIHYYIVSGGGFGGVGAGGIPSGALTGAGSSNKSGSVVSSLFGGGSSGGASNTTGASGRPGGFGRAGGAGSSAPGGGYSTSAITKWVEAHFHKETIGGETVYNLTDPS